MTDSATPHQPSDVQMLPDIYDDASAMTAKPLIIGIVGCHAGMQVGNNAESLGQKTSSSVVTAIFAVIVTDAIFSVFFAQVGV